MIFALRDWMAGLESGELLRRAEEIFESYVAMIWT
jgi:hypothetical protein